MALFEESARCVGLCWIRVEDDDGDDVVLGALNCGCRRS